MNKKLLFLYFLLLWIGGNAQQRDKFILLKPDRVFDGEQMHTGWVCYSYGQLCLASFRTYYPRLSFLPQGY